MKLVFFSETDDPAPWREALRTALPGIDFRVWPDVGDPADVRYTLVWKPPAGWHRRFPALRAILSLGAGVDALLEDPDLPAGVPITRMVDAGMGRQMAEYAAHGVMHFHRRMPEYAALQREGRWQPLECPAATEFPVGVLGLGVLGAQAAQMLVAMGYPVNAWTRTPRTLPGVTCYAGDAGRAAFLAGSRVLVNFLPLTPDTRGLIDRSLLAGLPRGAYLVNLARGGHVVEDDLLAALDDGQLAGAMLDVFGSEPLPVGHRFWRHPRVIVTPHIAAVTMAEGAADQVIENLKRLEAGDTPRGLVDRSRGY
ncbi:MAG: glyoxylate/hydroxypyruvate reductase A [Betaproteobacteria bacterium]|nr:glyoxylate/hydroxypyruvate reductase A [Betaproteobacteria bacterium]